MMSQSTLDHGAPDAITERVIACLRRAYAASLGRALELDAQDVLACPLRELGIDSAATLSFLVEVEDEFGIEWTDDVPAEALNSLRNVARFVSRELGSV